MRGAVAVAASAMFGCAAAPEIEPAAPEWPGPTSVALRQQVMEKNWVDESDIQDGQFGAAVSSAGDVNGDGFDDVIVGAPGVGRAHVYLGSATGVEKSAVWTAAATTVTNFGVSVDSAGDVNGDGFDDVIVGDWSEGDGRVFVYLGSVVGPELTAAWVVDAPLGVEAFGVSVSGAGDVNGDGYDDVIVGAPGLVSTGDAFVFLGSTAGLDLSAVWQVTGPETDQLLGMSVAGSGDVDGDGFDDVLVGSPGWAKGRGRVEMYRGTATGPELEPDWWVRGKEAFDGINLGDGIGGQVAGAGDVNGDGRADVLVGAWAPDRQFVDEGRAFLFLGSASGLGQHTAWDAGSGQADVSLNAASPAGDVNGDGFDDVILGWRYWDGAFSDSGRASLYLGSADGPSTDPDWTETGAGTGAEFGTAASGAGDVNGDGLSDLVVGSPREANGEADEGRARVYLAVPEMP